MPVGLGFDIHRLVPGRRLILGGVEFAHPVGLLGHSDGDVVLHAVIDALLGATGGGDIGEKFPDSDPRWKGADSRTLLQQVMTELSPKWTVDNIDVTIVTEEPKLGTRKKDIARTIAELCSLEAGRVSVKAKTAEGLGAIGHREGIAALAVVLTLAR